MIEVLSNKYHPKLILNMDESGFARRKIEKSKSCIVNKQCEVDPYFRSTSDHYHISIVSCITTNCDSLKPMVITPRKTLDCDCQDTFLLRGLEIEYSKKGYMTTETMLSWVQKILIPYISDVREELNDNDFPVVLLMDSLTSHFNDGILEILNEIPNLFYIPLPAHSSHLTQPNDMCLFGVMKNKYQSIKTNKKYTKFTRKLLRVKDSYYQSISPENIRSSWERSGFNIQVHNGTVTSVRFDLNKAEKILLISS